MDPYDFLGNIMVEISQMRTKVTNSLLRKAAVQKEENTPTPTQYCSNSLLGAATVFSTVLSTTLSLSLSVSFPFNQI